MNVKELFKIKLRSMNTVLMQTGFKFYGKTSLPASGFGLPIAGVKANDTAPNHMIVCKTVVACFDFLVICSCIVLILDHVNQHECGMFGRDAR